jgi:uncharacterized repeat protein (TIGR01451 family)
MKLAVWRELFGAGPGGDKLAQSVAGSLSVHPSPGSYTTQELAWGISGLGKSVGSNAAPIPALTLRAGGRELKPGGSTPGEWAYTLSGGSGLAVELAVPASTTGGLYAVVSTEGNRQEQATRYGSAGLRLTRRYLDGAGNETDPARVGLGDTLFVELVVRNLSGHPAENLALVDRIPAGWEIENPRLGRGRLPGTIDTETLWTVEHMNLRDDRLEVFGALPDTAERRLVYQVRAVTSGEWALPEASFEAMYDPSLWARVPGDRVSVVGAWAGFLL